MIMIKRMKWKKSIIVFTNTQKFICVWIEIYRFQITKCNVAKSPRTICCWSMHTMYIVHAHAIKTTSTEHTIVWETIYDESIKYPQMANMHRATRGYYRGPTSTHNTLYKCHILSFWAYKFPSNFNMFLSILRTSNGFNDFNVFNSNNIPTWTKPLVKFQTKVSRECEKPKNDGPKDKTTVRSCKNFTNLLETPKISAIIWIQFCQEIRTEP